MNSQDIQNLLVPDEIEIAGRAYYRALPEATKISMGGYEQQKQPGTTLTLTFDFNYAKETRSAQEILREAEAIIQAVEAHTRPVIHVVIHGMAEAFTEILQRRNPDLTVNKIFRCVPTIGCTPCACSPTPQQTEKMCFQFASRAKPCLDGQVQTAPCAASPPPQ